MSKVTEALATLGIHNPHNFAVAGGARIYVTYNPEMTGRMNRGAQYSVVGIDFKADPDAPWYNYGDKVFTVFHYDGDKHKARDEALEWATQTFHIEEWAKMPYRESWVEKLAYDKVMKMLKSNRGDANGRDTVGED